MTSPALRKGGYYHFIDKARIATTNVTRTVDSIPGNWYSKRAGERAIVVLNELLDNESEYLARTSEGKYYNKDDRKYISGEADRESRYASEVGTSVHWCIEKEWDCDVDAFLDEPSETIPEDYRCYKCGSTDWRERLPMKKKPDKGKTCDARSHDSHWDIIVKYEDDREKVIAHILAHERGYREFISDYSFEIIRREVTVYNSIHDYAGTLDVYGRSWNDLILADYKTGKPKIDRRTKKLYPSVELQMQGYGHCDFLVDNGEYIPIEEFPDYALVVELTTKGYIARKVEFTDAAFTAFLHIREYCRWEEER